MLRRARAAFDGERLMAIFVDANPRSFVQGLTGGRQVPRPAQRAYGTKVVGGVTPGKGGQDVEGHPRLRLRGRGRERTGANASFISVHRRPRPRAILEAAAAGIAFVVCIKKGVPAQDEAKVFNTLHATIPAPGCSGRTARASSARASANIGITAGEIALAPSPVSRRWAIVSRSGTLTYQALYELKQKGISGLDLRRHRRDPVPERASVDCLGS